ncbi:MAG: alkaline phosphatase family protein [Actinomycetota bacterium]|nr:alkaline phosphatase family protein [Actinomycetota bacterium]
MPLSRRTLLQGAVFGGGFGALATTELRRPAEAREEPSYAPISRLPAPAASGIEHVVVAMVENRSFDHLLGWLPEADGRQSGLTYLDRHGKPHATHHLTRFDGCGLADPSHSIAGGRIEFNHGACDGWMRARANDTECIGYYTQPDLPFLGQAAPSWTVFDRYFAATLAETYPNRLYLHAGQTDRMHNSMVLAKMPTIWDRLAEAGVSGTYYFNDVPFLALWGSKYISTAKRYDDFLSDAATGKLPAVSFVDPRFQQELRGTSGDYHPPGDIRAGEAWLNEVYDAVRHSPNWATTVLVISFDEWGGYFDHVPPRRAPDTNMFTARRGFRVPAMLISPRARRAAVNHHTYDHTSILKMIEWRWGLAPLAPRDRAARNIAEALNYSEPANLHSPTFTVPAFISPGCASASRSLGAPTEATEMPALKELALQHGWPLIGPP